MPTKKSLLILFLALLAIGHAKAQDAGPKKITITGLNGRMGNVMIVLSEDLSDMNIDINYVTAIGVGKIANNSVTLELMNETMTGYWTGSGAYFAMLIFTDSSFTDSNAGYMYTNGLPIIELMTNDDVFIQRMGLVSLKLSITRNTTTVAFSKFSRIY